MFDSMVNEFAHNYFVNKSESLDMNLQVSFLLQRYNFIRKTQTATERRHARKRRRFSRNATRSTETTLRWVTFFKKTKTKWT